MLQGAVSLQQGNLQGTAQNMVTWTDIGFIVLSIILPPLAVFLKSEEFGKGRDLAYPMLTINTSKLVSVVKFWYSESSDAAISAADFVLNCLLSIFGWFPGQLHAVYFVCTYEVSLLAPARAADITTVFHRPCE